MEILEQIGLWLMAIAITVGVIAYTIALLALANRTVKKLIQQKGR